MPFRLTMNAEGACFRREFELKPLGPGDVRVKVRFAAPKHGTEKNLLAGSPFVGKRWDSELRLFLPHAAETQAPAASTERGIGNTVVGEVIAVGADVTKFAVGAEVFGYGPVAEIHQAPEKNWYPLGSLSDVAAVCIDPAHVALVATRDGNIRLGDTVAVYGLGAIGLLAVQCARASGARNVFAVDPVASRREFALWHGADAAFDPFTQDAALEIKRATKNQGADVALETSGNGRALHDAIRCLRVCGTLVHVAWGPRDASSVHFDEEFHHNRITFVGSQAVWGNPDRDHPRWDLNRAFSMAAGLLDDSILTADGLVTPILEFATAHETLGPAFADPTAAIKIGVQF